MFRVLSLVFIFSYNCQAIAQQNLPNLVIFLADDMGWGDISRNGNTIINTPNIDSLAEQGAQFNTFLVNPVCAPSRAALLTGRHALRTGVYSVTRGGDKMRESEQTLAEILRDNGYSTGAFGKWHNGSHYPHNANGQGFDQFVGFSDGHQTLYFNPTLEFNNQKIKTNGYIADITTDYAIQFIKDNKEQPFLAYLPYNTPHGPFEVPDQYFKKYKALGENDLNASIYAMVDNMDWNIGRVLENLEELGLTKDTIVIFLTDNGPAFPNNITRYNGSLKGKKGKVDLGGILSPLHVKYPNKIPNPIKVSQTAQHIDLVPTLLSLMGINPPQNIRFDGVDLSNHLTKENSQLFDRYLFTHHFRNTQNRQQKAVQLTPASVLYDPWFATVNENEEWSLFNIADDLQQVKDVSELNKGILKQLQRKYKTWYAEVTQGIEEIPTHIGHKQQRQVSLATHEAHLSGKGINYAKQYGWAHDWIVINTPSNAKLDFPIKVAGDAKFRLSIQYQNTYLTPEKSISINIQGQSCDLPEIKPFTAKFDYGNRIFFTDEAPETNWSNLTICELNLVQGISSLEMNFHNSKIKNLAIKSLVLHRIN